jgi:histidyl-tRNA synthetase
MSKKTVKKIINKTVKKSKKPDVKERESLLLQPPRGMKDILPEEQGFWDQVRRTSEKLAREYGFLRIDVPMVEFTNLFVRGVGESTDVVQKEMYNFVTRGGDKVSLRPELTAGICRSYIQHGMNVWPKPIKLFSF